MKITALHVDTLDLSRDAWRLSRSFDAAASWRDTYTIDVPVNEIPGAALHFEGFTILEREIFSSLRNHVMWARTSHVDDPTKFTVPHALAQPTTNELARSCMVLERANGGPQDEWRRHLPVTSETAWTTRMSFRDLAKLVRYFEHLSFHNKIASDALKERFDEVASSLVEVIDAFTGNRALSLVAVDATQFAKFLHEGTVDDGFIADSDAEFSIFRMTVPLWLRAQIVRHRPLLFVDDFFATVLADENVLHKTIEHPINMEVAATKDFWRTILSKRTCWLAQDALTKGRRDPWQEIIDRYGFTEDMLPCADGKCPYHGDAHERVVGRDPGCPCPKFLAINNLDIVPFLDRMPEALASRHEHWQRLIENTWHISIGSTTKGV